MMKEHTRPDPEKVIRGLEARVGGPLSNREIVDLFDTHIRPFVDAAEAYHVMHHVIFEAIRDRDHETDIAARRKQCECLPNPAAFWGLGRTLASAGRVAEAAIAFDQAIDTAISARKYVAQAVQEQLRAGISLRDAAFAECALERLFSWYRDGGRSEEDGGPSLDLLPDLKAIGVREEALEEYRAIAKTGVLRKLKAGEAMEMILQIGRRESSG